MIKKTKGFTLIELLVVIAIIAILAAAVFVAVNPARRFAEANNAKRWTDVTAILNAVLTYVVDNNGSMPSGLNAYSGTGYIVGYDAAGCDAGCPAATTYGVTTTVACLPIGASLVSTGYLSATPTDPAVGTDDSNTLYFIHRNNLGIVTVGACSPEAEGGTTPTIKVAR